MSGENPENSVGSKKPLIIVALVSVVCIGIVAAVFSPLGVGPSWYQNYAPKQPIPFSHKIHAGQYNIPCLYCHGAAEYAAHAEVPGVELCMNCHSVVKTDSPFIKQVKEAFDSNRPLQWTKVHVLPDFVHFNHKRHIAAGVQCETCHGPVKTMERVYQYSALTMGWCINCHRDNNYVGPSRAEWTQAKDALKGKGLKDEPFWFQMLSHPDPQNADVSCSTCHY
jgi:hypothetical protein